VVSSDEGVGEYGGGKSLGFSSVFLLTAEVEPEDLEISDFDEEKSDSEGSGSAAVTKDDTDGVL
jgi:hypothetical protein